MITYQSGNVFNSKSQVITNTVNCVGIMGKGLALAFKERHPDMFLDYVRRCEKGEVKIGEPYLWENDEVQVLNFPTKRHWREGSRLEDVEAGLKYLSENYAELGISSIALPKLGCGLGGLHWPDVKALIEKHLGSIYDLDVYVYEDQAVSSGDDQEKNKVRLKSPKSTSGIAASQQSLI